MEIDERDVMNLCRHAYLIGFNSGMNTMMPSNKEDLFDEAERDEYLKMNMDDCKAAGFMSYGCDQGSQGHCPPGCTGLGPEELDYE